VRTSQPNLAAAHGIIGAAKALLGRAEETETHVAEALRLSPRDTYAYQWMVWVGLAKAQLHRDTEAVAWLRRGLEANRNYSNAHFYLALRWRALESRIRHGSRYKRDLHSIQPSPSAAGVAPISRGAITRLTLPAANAPLRDCAWPGCLRAED
jgi:tetratricopeptide (TPR) repeat protein